MKSSVRLAAIGGVATVATALLTGTSLAATQQDAAPPPGERSGGSLTPIGSVTVPGAVGGEGIAAS